MTNNDQKNEEKLIQILRNNNWLKEKIEDALYIYQKINVPACLDGCKEHNQVKTLSSMLSNKSYIKQQLKTEDGEANVLLLLQSFKEELKKLRKLIIDKEIVDETEMEG